MVVGVEVVVGVVAASGKDVDNLSLQLNQKLLKLFPKNPAWYKLFRHSTRRARILDLEGLRVMNARNLPCSVDDDGAGKITYAELLDMVRSELEISSSEMPDSMLKRVWVALDKDGSGSISDWELRAMLQSMGQDPSDEELFDMIAAVDDDGSAEIDFGEFCKVIANQKNASAAQNDETDTGARCHAFRVSLCWSPPPHPCPCLPGDSRLAISPGLPGAWLSQPPGDSQVEREGGAWPG